MAMISWVRCFSSIIDENEEGITLSTMSGTTVSFGPERYRKNEDGILELCSRGTPLYLFFERLTNLGLDVRY